MPDLIPVEHDPFNDPPSPLVPVDYDPFVNPIPQGTTQQLGNVLKDIGSGIANTLALPGDVATGKTYVQPSVPGQWSDEDEARLQATNADIGNRAPALAGMAMTGAMPASETNALGMGIRAYHGSPYDFDKFDLSKIGTGEGAQAYGHGLYFAENPATAKMYKDSLTPITFNGQRADFLDPDHVAALTAHQYGGDREAAIRDFQRELPRATNDEDRQHIQRVLDVLQSDKPLLKPDNPGKTYEVSINADPEHFLDWDKPLSEQHPAIKDQVTKAFGAETPTLVGQGENGRWLTLDEKGNAIGRPDGWPDEATAKDAAKVLSQDADRMLAKTPQDLLKTNSQAINLDRTQKLRDAGIPGIKYLDQGSRNAGDGTRNYVVFDDKLIDIAKKYGLAGLVAGGAAHFNTTPVEHDPFGQ